MLAVTIDRRVIIVTAENPYGRDESLHPKSDHARHRLREHRGWHNSTRRRRGRHTPATPESLARAARPAAERNGARARAFHVDPHVFRVIDPARQGRDVARRALLRRLLPVRSTALLAGLAAGGHGRNAVR